MKLYFHPLSPYSQKVLIALYEKDIPFEGEEVNLFDPAVRAKYQAEVNPLCKMPLLLRDNGWVVPESSIILEFLDTYYATGPQLIPADRDQARQTRFYDRLGDLYVIDPGGVLFFEGMKPPASRDEALVSRTLDKLRIAVGLFEKELKEREYLVGGQFSMADIAPGIGLQSAGSRGVDLADFPKVQAYLQRLWSRPAWQRVGAEAGAAAAKLQASAGPVSEG